MSLLQLPVTHAFIHLTFTRTCPIHILRLKSQYLKNYNETINFATQWGGEEAAMSKTNWLNHNHQKNWIYFCRKVPKRICQIVWVLHVFQILCSCHLSSLLLHQSPPSPKPSCVATKRPLQKVLQLWNIISLFSLLSLLSPPASLYSIQSEQIASQLYPKFNYLFVISISLFGWALFCW